MDSSLGTQAEASPIQGGCPLPVVLSDDGYPHTDVSDCLDWHNKDGRLGAL